MIITTVVSLFTLMIGSLFFILEYELSQTLSNLILIITIATSLVLIFMFVALVKQRVTHRIVISILKFFESILGGRLNQLGFREKTHRILNTFFHGVEILAKNPRSLLGALPFSVVACLLNLLVPYLVFISLDVKIPFSATVIVNSIMGAIRMIPVGIPGDLGFAEVIMIGLYVPFNIPIVISAAATLLIRLITFWFRATVVGFMLQIKGLSTTEMLPLYSYPREGKVV